MKNIPTSNKEMPRLLAVPLSGAIVITGADGSLLVLFPANCGCLMTKFRPTAVLTTSV